MQIMDYVSTAAAAALPLFDIPLIVRIIRRKSAADISLSWIIGLWVCSVGMAPAAIISSQDLVWKTFNIVNVILLTGVLIAVLCYRQGNQAEIKQ